MADVRRAGRWLINFDRVEHAELIYSGLDYAAVVQFAGGNDLQLNDRDARELFGIEDRPAAPDLVRCTCGCGTYHKRGEARPHQPHDGAHAVLDVDAELEDLAATTAE